MNAPIKATVTLEPRPLYGIGTVARLTGLKSDTLRVWERRYGLGASYKSATGRRQYTQSDLDHLQLVSALVKQGVRIGEIAASDRKTLEVLLEQQYQPATSKPLPPTKSPPFWNAVNRKKRAKSGFMAASCGSTRACWISRPKPNSTPFECRTMNMCAVRSWWNTET